MRGRTAREQREVPQRDGKLASQPNMFLLWLPGSLWLSPAQTKSPAAAMALNQLPVQLPTQLHVPTQPPVQLPAQLHAPTLLPALLPPISLH